jgi:polar amino acid transport system substrate-binding protein
VQAGHVDCFAFDDLSLRELTKDSPLLEPVDQALKDLHDSGEWLRMVKPFGLSEVNEPPADLTIEKACAG